MVVMMVVVTVVMSTVMMMAVMMMMVVMMTRAVRMMMMINTLVGEGVSRGSFSQENPEQSNYIFGNIFQNIFKPFKYN